MCLAQGLGPIKHLRMEMSSGEFLLANVFPGKSRKDELEIQQLSEFTPYAPLLLFLALSGQLFLKSSCVLISMDEHPAPLINTRPVND